MDYKKAYKNQVKIYKNIRKSNQFLHLERKFISVSDIAEQYYCEKRLELQEIHREDVSEERVLGRKGHENLIKGLKKSSVRKGWKEIAQEGLHILSESLFLAQYNNLYFVFQPDRIVLEYPAINMLIEFKFSKYFTPFKSYHVQLQVEGFLLKSLGFITDSMYYLIIISPAHMSKMSDLIISIFNRIYFFRDDIELGKPIKDNSIISYLYKFDDKEAQKNLDWALEFWSEKRNAQKADNKNRCRSCNLQVCCK